MIRFLRISLPRVTIATVLLSQMAFADTGQNGVSDGDYLDGLFLELLDAGPNEWPQIEGEIGTIWSDSGSDSMNLLLERGHAAIIAQDFPKAIEHLSALIDHAPEFAEGYNSRATAYYLAGELGLSLDDIRSTLSINPRHFGALAGLGLIYEELGNPEGALSAYHALQAIHPHLENVNAAVIRLQQQVEGEDI